MPCSVCPTLCCLVAAFACLHPLPISGEDATPTPLQRLQTALQAFQKASAVLSLDSKSRTFRDGREQSRASMSAMVPLDGSERFAVLGSTPLLETEPSPSVESNLRTIFNGRYWALATFDKGPVGGALTAEKTLQISWQVPAAFSTYPHTTALSLCLPFVRFHKSDGSFSLKQLLSGEVSREWTLTEEKRGVASVLKLSLPPAEWLIIDPEKPFVVLEHVVARKGQRQETRARKVGLTSCGLWFATDHVFAVTQNGSETLRIETSLQDVTFVEKDLQAKMLKPRYGSGWLIKDERTRQQHFIQDDEDEIFHKLDAVTP